MRHEISTQCLQGCTCPRGYPQPGHAKVQGFALADLYIHVTELRLVLRVSPLVQRGQAGTGIEQHSEPHPTGHHRLGAVLRLCHRQTGQRLSGRSLQCAPLHDAGPAAQRHRQCLHGHDHQHHHSDPDLGPQWLGPIHGGRAVRGLAVALVHRQGTRDLLWLLVDCPQPGRSLDLRGRGRCGGDLGLAVRLLARHPDGPGGAGPDLLFYGRLATKLRFPPGTSP